MSEPALGSLFVSRRINSDLRPFAIVNPNGPHGDEIVAGFMTKEVAVLFAAAPETAAERDRLKASNAVLSAALEEIARQKLSTETEDIGDPVDGLDCCIECARAAIAKAEPS